MHNKIFIGTPCYGGMITADYFKSCMQLVALASSRKIELQFGTIGNESLITRARTLLFNYLWMVIIRIYCSLILT